MLESIKASRPRVKWNLREAHVVTQWKENCVYRTRSIGMIVCLPEYAEYLRINNQPNLIIGSVSTRISRLING